MKLLTGAVALIAVAGAAWAEPSTSPKADSPIEVAQTSKRERMTPAEADRAFKDTAKAGLLLLMLLQDMGG